MQSFRTLIGSANVRISLVIALLALVTVGCTPSAPSPTSGSGAGSNPVWQTIPLTDVRNGNTFKIADFAGKTIYVEAMATWCPPCRTQLNNVLEAKSELNSDSQYVFIAISVETDLSASDLADYSQKNSFDWPFVVASPEFLTELSNTFGRSVLNPPATPHFVIYPDGRVSSLFAGTIHSSDDIVGLLRQ